ncbi:MAG TPA: hypothetical protein VF630_19810 [Hymenobacter sp.]
MELTAFTAAGPAAVRPAWATASEKNSQQFGVERSADGVAFARIGTAALVLPAGTMASVYVVRTGNKALRLTVE